MPMPSASAGDASSATRASNSIDHEVCPMTSELRYQSGFGIQFASEAVAGTLPIGRNSPQKVARGLYAELVSGTAFTAPRAANLRTWLYRRRPSVLCGAYAPYPHPWPQSGAGGG